MFTVILQKQRQAEEQNRLRKIQEALEAERKQKELEELKIREEEENRRKYGFTISIFQITHNFKQLYKNVHYFCCSEFTGELKWSKIANWKNWSVNVRKRRI